MIRLGVSRVSGARLSVVRSVEFGVPSARRVAGGMSPGIMKVGRVTPVAEFEACKIDSVGAARNITIVRVNRMGHRLNIDHDRTGRHYQVTGMNLILNIAMIVSMGLIKVAVIDLIP